jgi:hypothetical protein
MKNGALIIYATRPDTILKSFIDKIRINPSAEDATI